MGGIAHVFPLWQMSTINASSSGFHWPHSTQTHLLIWQCTTFKWSSALPSTMRWNRKLLIVTPYFHLLFTHPKASDRGFSKSSSPPPPQVKIPQIVLCYYPGWWKQNWIVKSSNVISPSSVSGDFGKCEGIVMSIGTTAASNTPSFTYSFATPLQLNIRLAPSLLPFWCLLPWNKPSK